MPGLSTRDGTPTGGVYGFAVMALEVIKRLKPDYVCVAWDKPKTNIRKRLELYPEYKAGRKPAPADFKQQIPVLHELLQAFGWPLYELDDYEADDIMGTLSFQAAEQGIETMLITSDLDMLQLVHPLIHLYALKKGLSNIELFRPETFIMKYGIKPEQFLDLKALKGDSSDNIPGVPGIGEKGAIELLKQFKTLDGVYENIELTKGATKTKLENGKELAYLSKQIAAIWTDAPLKLDLNEVDGSKCNPNDVAAMLQKLEFRTLARQLPDIMKVDPYQVSPANATELTPATVIHITTHAELQKIAIPKTGTMVLQTYCRGKHGRDPQYLGVSFKPDTMYLIDCDGDISASHLAQFIAATQHIGLIGHDLKSSMKVAYTCDTSFGPVAHDVLIGSFLINSLRREQSLTELAQADLGYAGPDLDGISPEEFFERAGTLVAAIHALHEQQVKQLDDMPKVKRLAQDMEWPVITVLAEMEYEGIHLDTQYLSKMGCEVEDMISDLEQQIYGHADTEFNIGSPAQLADVLFNKLQLPTMGIKKGKTGYSTDANQLDKLRASHPIIDLVTQWREVTKLKNTYIDTLPKQTDEQSRVHTTYSLTVAQTGRLSSNDPNLQNIPVRTELGKRIRTAFTAAPGNVFVSADYSQFELRLAAYLADDKELVEMFNRDIDIHTATAAQVYGRTPEEVTKQMRRDAKVINFGVLYGMSPHGLSVATGMTMVAAKAFIDKYFELRKPLLTYMNGLKIIAREQGYVETLFGRRRPMPDIHSSNFIVRQAAERAAINMPIQGTEADLMKMAMIVVQNRLKDTDCKQLLQIHDSILVECPESEAERTAALLKDSMENVYKLPVKLTVDTSIGKNWGEL